ncbi:hypothetical protein [Desulfoscipio geothermicus]|nr:hypothetical protein [Desulfoscipio geothermicus]
MPKTLEEMTDPKWKGQFAITRGGNGSMVATRELLDLKSQPSLFN